MAGLSKAALKNKVKGKTVPQSPGIKKGTKRSSKTVIQDEESEKSESESSQGSRSSARLGAKRVKKSRGVDSIFGSASQLSPIREEADSPTQLDNECRTEVDEESSDEADEGQIHGEEKEDDEDDDDEDDDDEEDAVDVFGALNSSALDPDMSLPWDDDLNNSTASALNVSTASVLDVNKVVLRAFEREGEKPVDYGTGGEDWNHASPLVWDASDRYVVYPDEVESVYRTLLVDGAKTTRKKTLQNKFVTLCFTMLSCYVMDAISVKVERVHKRELFLLAESRFSQAFKNLKLKAYEQEAFFGKLKAGTMDGTATRNWPQCVTDYVEELYLTVTPAGKPSVGMNWAKNESILNKLTDSDEDTVIKMQCFVGSRIHAAWVDAKGQITSHVARQWLPPSKLPSGFTEENLFRAIRKTLWRMEAYKRAKNTLKTAKSNQKKAGEVIDLEIEEKDFEDRAKANLAAMTFEWYPDYWLAFVVYSVPAGEKCLLTLNGGNAAIATVNPLATATQAAATFNRAARQVTSPGGSGLPVPVSAILSPNTTVQVAAKTKQLKSRAVLDAERVLAAQDKAELAGVVSAAKDGLHHDVVVTGGQVEQQRDKLLAQKELVVVLKARNKVTEAEAAEDKYIQMLMDFVDK